MLEAAFYLFVLLVLVLPGLCLAALVALVSPARWLRRSVPGWPSGVRRWAKAMTVDPEPGKAFNDSRDVWPTPADD
ncbi:hypothetical protein [Micromonospora palythoicola]|uniref:hypothetical protein n=1 Tax=Micromonospora palythoicola TaxID=3120507 RepID=UPI002FCE3747